MSKILVEEIARTEESYRTAQLDSRLGYEWGMDYVYSPMVIEEKLQVLHKTLEAEIPAHRKSFRAIGGFFDCKFLLRSISEQHGIAKKKEE